MNDAEARHEACNALAVIIQETELYMRRYQAHRCDFYRLVQSIHDRAKHDYFRLIDRPADNSTVPPK